MATPTVGESVVRIPVRGKGGVHAGFVLVDAEFAHLAAYSWRLNLRGGYPIRNARSASGKVLTFYIHREVAGLTHGDGRHVDHINRDKLDNRWCNLRIVTLGQNNQNVGAHKDGRSGIRGAHYSHGKWRGKVIHRGVEYYLGTFKTTEDAGVAASAKRRELGFLGEPQPSPPAKEGGR